MEAILVLAFLCLGIKHASWAFDAGMTDSVMMTTGLQSAILKALMSGVALSWITTLLRVTEKTWSSIVIAYGTGGCMFIMAVMVSP